MFKWNNPSQSNSYRPQNKRGLYTAFVIQDFLISHGLSIIGKSDENVNSNLRNWHFKMPIATQIIKLAVYFNPYTCVRIILNSKDCFVLLIFNGSNIQSEICQPVALVFVLEANNRHSSSLNTKTLINPVTVSYAL